MQGGRDVYEIGVLRQTETHTGLVGRDAPGLDPHKYGDAASRVVPLYENKNRKSMLDFHG